MNTSMTRLCGFAFVLCFAVSAGAEEGAPPEMATMCEGCHGPGGVSEIETVPTIAGFSEWVLEDNLHAYQDGIRPCLMPDSDAMCTMMAALSSDQIEELGHYYAELPFEPADQPFDADKAATGQALHEEHCAKCHTEGGSNPDDDAAILAGQWIPYLVAQMKFFASGEREGLPPMVTNLEELTEEQIEALAHYYASQQ